MSTFGTIYTRVLQITTNHVNTTMAKALVNRCAQEELEARPWTFRRTNAAFNAAAPITTGTVDMSQGSPIVMGTGTAFTQADVGKQFRVGAGTSTVGLFTIQSVQSATQLTLTSTFPSASVATQPYIIFQQYYSLSGADQILSIQGGNQLNLEETTHEALNRRDPLRQSTANPPTSWAPKGRDSLNNAQFELWPVASAASPFVAEYLVGFTAMVGDTDQCIVPGAIVENKALADAAMSCFSETGDSRWAEIADGFGKRYVKELEDQVNADERRYGIQPQVRDVNGGRNPGIDLTYNHDYGPTYD